MRTNKLIEHVIINNDNITRIVKNLYLNKSRDRDNLSMRMIEIHDHSIFYPLNFILNFILIDSLKEGIFPKSWKKANTVPAH